MDLRSGVEAAKAQHGSAVWRCYAAAEVTAMRCDAHGSGSTVANGVSASGRIRHGGNWRERAMSSPAW